MSQTSPPANRPGGYNRSFGGLVGAMIVMVVAVVLVWLALGLFRDDAEFEPTPIDYDASMAALADRGAALAYPETLPEGWRVNNLAYDPADPSFSLALLTDDERFVGVYHGREDLDEVLATMREVPPGGHFLGTAHTLANFQSAFSMPEMMNSDNYEQWLADGAMSAEERATSKCLELLETYEEPRLPDDVRTELDEFIARRELELPDTVT